MKSHRNRTRTRFELEALEGRVALSHMGAVVEDGSHHNQAGHPREIQSLNHRADDPANHKAHDAKGMVEIVHHHNGGVIAATHGRHGADDPAGHK